MSRVVLISWDRVGSPATASAVREAGHPMRGLAPSGTADIRPVLERPPDAFVDLDRRPSEGRSVAVLLRQRKTTRHVPLVFVGGAAVDVARVQSLLRTARSSPAGRESTPRSKLRSRTRRRRPWCAGRWTPAGAPVSQKLGLRTAVTLLNASTGWEANLEGAPVVPPPADLAILFVHAELERELERATAAFTDGGSLWIVWPKRASGHGSDLTQVSVRRFGMDHGSVDHKVAALDETWSGLRFARKRG